MTTTSKFSDHIAGMYTSLEQRRLKEVFDSLSLLLNEPTNWQLNEQKNELELTYKAMLTYLTNGIKDPDQDAIYYDLLRSCYKLVDSTKLEINIKKTNLPLIHQLSSIIQSLENANEDKNNAIQLFHTIWLSKHWHTDEKILIIQALNNKTYSLAIHCLIISAITLSLQALFDEQKAMILLNACEHTSNEVRQRALVALLLFLRKYDKRLFLYPQITSRLQHLAENHEFTKSIKDILLQFIISKDTEKITRKIKEEILPEMMKISPILSEKIKLEDLMGETGTDEKNPEWTKMLEEIGLSEKMQEFSELQQKGVDIMHSSFAHLKNYTFFNEISNWFLPFSADNSSVEGMANKMALLKLLETSSILCNSDKYSFYFSMMQMPESYGDMISQQFLNESNALEELQKEDLLGHSKEGNIIAKQYIQDLYRFHKIHPRKKDFDDIFDEKPDFYAVSSIRQLLPDNQSKLVIAEFYFNYNYFEEAINIFDELLEIEDTKFDVLFQKKGYCLQVMNDTEGALESYLRAELFSAANPWLIKKIAHCYRSLKDNENALHYYQKAELLNPDNMSIQLNIGHCYLELKNYTEALKCYFKVEYLDKNGKKAWRPIAWCSFLTVKYEQAMHYFEKILTENPTTSDYLNAGHTCLAMGNMKQAIQHYTSSMRSNGNSEEKFRIAFLKDFPELIQSGIRERDIPLVLDRMMYHNG